MIRYTLVFVAFALAGLAVRAAAAEPFRVLDATPAGDLDAIFARQKGWVGADGNYSVQIAPDRILWFYSDTWIGEIAGGRRENCVLVNNSVGVQTGERGESRVEFFWGTTAAGKPAALFVPDDGHGWFWLFGGTFAGGRLHLLLWQMEKASGPAAFAFRNVAVWHAEVTNPQDPPPQWRTTLRKLPFTELSPDRRVLFGSAVLSHDDQVYVYGVDERPLDKSFGRRMILARVGTGEMATFDRWRFWSADGWASDFRRVQPLAAGMATEYSVTRMAAWGKFVAVTSDVFLSPNIVARVAEEPWGPWSEPVPLYTCQEPTWSKSIFCYAGKAHASLSSPGELVISYAANSSDFGELFSNPRLYWPRFVRVKVSR